MIHLCYCTSVESTKIKIFNTRKGASLDKLGQLVDRNKDALIMQSKCKCIHVEQKGDTWPIKVPQNPRKAEKLSKCLFKNRKKI
jgi:hypothetical protein